MPRDPCGSTHRPAAHTYRSDLSSNVLSARLTGTRRRSCCGSAADGGAHMPISTAAPAMMPVTLSRLPWECGWTRTSIRWRPPADRRALGRANNGTNKIHSGTGRPRPLLLLLLTSRCFQLLLFKTSVPVVRPGDFTYKNRWVLIPRLRMRRLRGRGSAVPGRFPGGPASERAANGRGRVALVVVNFKINCRAYVSAHTLSRNVSTSRLPELWSRRHSLVRLWAYILFKTYKRTQISVAVFDEF